VILDRILVQERRLQFSIMQEGIPLTEKRSPKPPSKAKKNKRRDATSKPPRTKKHTTRKGKRR
jgi:ribonuclease R